MSKFVAGHVTTENVIFKILNYLFLNSNFALIFKENVEKMM